MAGNKENGPANFYAHRRGIKPAPGRKAGQGNIAAPAAAYPKGGGIYPAALRAFADPLDGGAISQLESQLFPDPVPPGEELHLWAIPDRDPLERSAKNPGGFGHDRIGSGLRIRI